MRDAFLWPDRRTGDQRKKSGARKLHPSNSNFHQNLTFSLVHWNSRSLNSDAKFNFVLQFNADITLIQESWAVSPRFQQLLPDNEIIHAKRHGQGGGTLVWIKGFPFKVHRCINVNQDTKLLRILLGRDKFIWISSVYLSKGTPQQVKALFNKIYLEIPPNEWKYLLLPGDYNVNLKVSNYKSNLLLNLIKQFKLVIARPQIDTHFDSEIDFIIHGSKVQVSSSFSSLSPSDHALLGWNISVPTPDSKPIILIPNRKIAEEITLNSFNAAHNSLDFLKAIGQQRVRVQNALKIPIKPKQYKPPCISKLLESEPDSDLNKMLREFWSDYNKKMEEFRYSGISSNLFNYLKNAFRYDRINKKDGGIINSLLDDVGSLITERKTIAKELLQTLAEFQVNPHIISPSSIDFPNICEEDFGNVSIILNSLSSGKAISWDGVSDIIFKKEFRGKAESILKDFWTNAASVDDIHFLCRLVPLNKKFPHIPTRRDMRPIIIQSPVLKLIEAGLLPTLRSYLLYQLHPSQTGFVPGSGIFVNIHRALDQILCRTSKKQRCYGLFIDFTSAYNTISHEKLFSRLIPILGEKKTQFLRAIYSRNQIDLKVREFIRTRV